MSDLQLTAINAALSKDWQKAIEANQSLLKNNKLDINSISRLAHAYAQTGKLDMAKKLYKKILILDKYNNIARKNLDKLNSISKSPKSNPKSQSSPFTLSPSQFLEEPGKTKTVSLINTAPAGILSHLNPGDPVVLLPKKYSIDIRTLNNIYLGALPDDFAFKIIRFLKAGYEYTTYVKSATKNSVSIFIRESKRAKKFASQPSFIAPSSQREIKIGDRKKEDSQDAELDEDSTNPISQDDSEEV